ncbi:hypothetical protein Lepto7376_0636 [[Leptolyngbya] sp. PCC 7376]|uniref:hypothetical protein n=1 Tax=[Leptolyngbya] sp. PCC 7376 TaxID=111781 RepID=UPI00029EDC4C|nr:hypothetical protein [[Leptolyngbya] sp. PCC 7376]AFY37047.1 hypothetical protein Lepto7376_0636 [[Leptolyngbya] sp. PCC 7376]
MPAKQDFTNFATERPNYFPGQFLLEDDFELQHKYLGDRQTYHNQSLQVSGILEGLEVTPIKDKKEVEIAAGTAIDSAGNLLVLKNKLNFSGFGELTKGTLFIQFIQEKTNKQQEEIAESFTRWTENIVVGIAETLTDEAIALCSYETIGDDEVRVDSAISEYSGVYLPNATNQNLSLRSGGTANPSLAVLNGSLKVTGDAETLGNQAIGQNLDVAGKVAIAYESQDADGDALTIGSTLRLGHNLQYGWVQSHGGKPLAVNPLGNNVGIGTTDPQDILEVVASSSGKALTLRGKPDATSPMLTFANPDNPQTTVITPRDSDILNIEYGSTTPLKIEQSGKVTIPGEISAGNKLTVAETLNLDGAKQLIFSDADTSNNLKVQLWSGYGLGINSDTLFYAADGNHSWRNKDGVTERMKLTTAAGGGLAVYGTGDSSFAGNLSISKTLTVSGSTAVNGNLTISGEASLGYEVAVTNFGAKLSSGFYENSGDPNAVGDVPDTSHTWSHLINARHSNRNNNNQLQIAASYAVNDRLFFRKISASGTNNPSWNEVATRGTNTFTGQQIFQNTISGAPEGYIKAQFVLSGGGVVSWGGINGRLKWTQRFIAITMQKSTFFPAGHINITQPTTSIPKSNVHDGKARSATAAGVLLKDWEALYAVHTVKGDQSAVSYRIVYYNKNFNPPSNWILVAVVNNDNGSIKLGSGQIIHKAQRNDFVIAGFVNSTGTIVGGSGFTARRRSKGLYDITFTRPFSTRPAIVAAQHNGDGSNTRDNAIVTVINAGNCRIKTGDGNGNASDRHFCFFCMGAV